MFANTLILAFSIIMIISSILAASTVFENSNSEQLRYFEFADGDEPQQQPPPGTSSDPLFRQVIVVPSKSRKRF